MYKFHRTRRYCRFYIDAFNFDLLNPTHSLSVNKMNHYANSKKNPHVSLSAKIEIMCCGNPKNKISAQTNISSHNNGSILMAKLEF